MAFDAEQAAITAARTSLTQSYQDRPDYAAELREEIYGGEQALPSLRENRDAAIRGLYDADKRMADRYANPESDIFIKDPYAREKLMSAQHQTELGGVQDIMRMIESREDVLGDILSKGLDLYDYGLKAEEFEYNAMLKDLENAMKIAEFNRKAAGTGAGAGAGAGLVELKKALQGQYDAAVAPDALGYGPWSTEAMTEVSDGITWNWDVGSQAWNKEPFTPPTGYEGLWTTPDPVLSWLDKTDQGTGFIEDIFGTAAIGEEQQEWPSDETSRYLGLVGQPITRENLAKYQAEKNRRDKAKSGSLSSWMEESFDQTPTAAPSASPTAAPTPATTQDIQGLSEYKADMSGFRDDKELEKEIAGFVSSESQVSPEQAAQMLYNSFNGAYSYDEIYTKIIYQMSGIDY